jgi:hypothetical protein
VKAGLDKVAEPVEVIINMTDTPKPDPRLRRLQRERQAATRCMAAPS